MDENRVTQAKGRDAAGKGSETERERPSRATITEKPHHISVDDPTLDRVDATSADSFPASDPPPRR